MIKCSIIFNGTFYRWTCSAVNFKKRELLELFIVFRIKSFKKFNSTIRISNRVFVIAFAFYGSVYTADVLADLINAMLNFFISHFY